MIETMKPESRLRGSCLCAAFKPLAGITRDRLALLCGEEQSLRHRDNLSHDLRCVHCGSRLYSVVRDGQYLHVMLGTPTDARSLRPTAHICVGSKAPWFEITDPLPQHVEFG